jgi:predicted Fe-Mo cluster-binding NifX family protein
MTCHIIRRIRTAHCKRGPEVCEKCREMDVDRICLLDICPPDAGLVQRRVIEVTIDGETEWREFDVVRVFADEQEAAAYAAQNGIEDIDS